MRLWILSSVLQRPCQVPGPGVRDALNLLESGLRLLLFMRLRSNRLVRSLVDDYCEKVASLSQEVSRVEEKSRHLKHSPGVSISNPRVAGISCRGVPTRPSLEEAKNACLPAWARRMAVRAAATPSADHPAGRKTLQYSDFSGSSVAASSASSFRSVECSAPTVVRSDGANGCVQNSRTEPSIVIVNAPHRNQSAKGDEHYRVDPTATRPACPELLRTCRCCIAARQTSKQATQARSSSCIFTTAAPDIAPSVRLRPTSSSHKNSSR